MAQESEGKPLSHAIVEAGVKAALADGNKGRYFIAEVDGAPAGQAMVTREWSDWRDGWFWWIQSVYVLPGYRRRGVYRRLHDHIRDAARGADGVCGLRLYVEVGNTPAQETYRAVGMADAGYRLFEEDWSTGSQSGGTAV
ncbi:MAG: GNAT family N-acetyltransferase [Phycisphaerales bacterium]|nr:GNAT family N-acetyltransferase [Phycisphaerales bacterium]